MNETLEAMARCSGSGGTGNEACLKVVSGV